MNNANVVEEFVPEDTGDMEIYKYLPVPESYVVKHHIRETKTACITTNDSVKINPSFEIKANQLYLIDLDKTYLTYEFKIKTTDNSTLTDTWFNKENLADGWFYKAIDDISFTAYNSSIEKSACPYYKAAFNVAMKHSKADYDRGLYDLYGYEYKGEAVPSASSVITLDDGQTPTSATARVTIKLKDMLETVNSIEQQLYMIYLKFQITMNGSLKLGIKHDTKKFIMDPTDLRLYFVANTPSNELEKQIIESYKGTPQLSYKIFSEAYKIFTAGSSVSFTLSQTKLFKNHCLVLGFMENAPFADEKATFNNITQPRGLTSIRVSDQGTTIYYDKQMKPGDYRQLYQDYLNCRELFGTIDECAVTYEDYCDKYFFICIPLTDFIIPKSVNIVVDLNFQNDEGRDHTYLYSVIYGDVLSKVDVRKQHFVSSN